MATLETYSAFKDYLVTSPAPHVAQVLVNRPQKHNAFTERMWKDFGPLFDQLSHDPQVRVIVLSAAGKNFTVGLDIQEASQGNILTGVSPGIDPARRAQQIRRYITKFQYSVSAVERCDKPIICLLHGLSYGIAIDISSCADIRLCTSNTTFSVKEVDVGLAADLGTLSRLPKIVGSFSWVKDVCLSARPFSAQEALQQGFVSEVLADKDAMMQKALDMASVLAEKSPVAVQGTKEILNHARDHSIGESLWYTAVWNQAAIQTGDVPEAIAAWQRRRKPTFEKL